MKNKGITLIALIITIIVMLILVAVTINMAVDGGLFDYAGDAATKTNIEKEKEQILLAYSSTKMATLYDEVTADVLQEELNKTFGFDENENPIAVAEDNADGTITVTMNNPLRYFLLNGKTIEKSDDKPQVALAARNITTNDYGKVISNYTCSDSTINQGLTSANISWQIVYADDNNIYLISSDYIPLDYVPYARGDSTKGKPANINATYPRSASFSGVISSYQGSTNITDERLKALNSKWHAYLEATSDTYVSNTSKAIAYLMDQDAWGGFACDKADYAIGGITLELLFKSCNQIYNNNEEVYLTKVEIKNGYLISNNSGTNWRAYFSSMMHSDERYYMINSKANACGAWIASPSGSGNDMYRTLYESGYSRNGKICDGSATTSDQYGFRPVICLSNNARLIDNGDNTFSLR